MALLSLVFSACDQDFDTEFVQQTTLPESTFPVNAVSVTPTATAINLIDILAAEEPQPIEVGTIQLSQALPANTVMVADVQVSRDADFAQFTTLDGTIADNKITIDPSALEDAYFNNITKNPAATTLYMRALLYTVTGGAAKAIIGTPGQNFFAAQNVAFTPEFRVNIEEAYYYVGAANGWSDSDKTYKFDNGGGDPYENPVFTVTVPAPYNEDGTRADNWFKIAPESAYTSGNFWGTLIGVRENGDTSTEGNLAGPGDIGAFNQPASDGATMYRISINMLEQTYTITPITFKVEPAYYYVGAANGWSDSDKTYVFSNGGGDPYDNPVYTCVVPAPFNEDGTRADNWFKIAPESAYTSGNFWANLFGVENNGDTSTSGSLAYGDVGAFNQPASDGALFYRISINPKEMTYTITPLNFKEYIYEAGVNNSWGGIEQPLYCADGNGTYTGFFYAQEDSWTDGKGAFKFKAEKDGWDNGNYGAGTSTDEGGTLIDSGESGNLFATPGFYRAEVNLVSMSYTLTPIKSIGIVGPAQAGGWNEDTDLTYNPATCAWEATIDLAADEMKFRANDDWAINWGGTADKLTQDGPNLKIAEAGTYFIQFFPLCETKSYCVITKK